MKIHSRRLTRVAGILLAAALVVSGGPVAASEERKPQPGFHWGVALAGFQAEGSAPDSNWSRYAENKEPYRDAVDFRHRYAEDIQRARDMGVNTFRFSVEWARTEPVRGKVDEAEFAYYDDVVAKIKAAGMTPMITLDHWVYPGWARDAGGWDNPEMTTAWLAHAKRVIQRYRGQDALWVTVNEPTIYLVQEMKYGELKSARAMLDGLVAAHRSAYDLIHELDPGALVTSNFVAMAPPLRDLNDRLFLDRVTDKLDFVGLDYYGWFSDLDDGVSHGRCPWKTDPQPDGLYYQLRHYQERFPELPLYVVENGLPTDNGTRPDGYQRADHLRDSIYWLQRAKADGVNVIGYNYWSITDNYEWGSYRPRFGLYTVNAATDPTLTRIPTDGVDAYRDITANGVPASYKPTHMPPWCADPTTCLNKLPYPRPGNQS